MEGHPATDPAPETFGARRRTMRTTPTTRARALRARSPRARALLGLLAALLAGGFLLGACSDDGDDEGSSDEGTTEGGEEEAADAAPVAGDAVTIADFAFDPPNLQVEAGTTVTFTNDDSATHTATAEDDSFDTGDLDQGASGEVTLDEPGTYAYFCNIHNYMTGSITVE
jgi:plastocyanin